FQAKVDVVDGMPGALRKKVVRAQVQPASEPAHPIEDQQLLVVSHVEKGHAPRQPILQKWRMSDAGGPQPASDWGVEISAAYPVNEDADLNPASARRLQGGDEVQSDAVGPEDIGSEGDAVLGIGNALEHGGVGLVAGPEDRQAVAADRREPRDPLAHARDGGNIG